MPEPDDDVIRIAARVFGLARAGASDELAAYVDAGVPVNLTKRQAVGGVGTGAGRRGR